MDLEERIRIRVRRPRNELLGCNVGERSAQLPASKARTTLGIATWFYCFATPSVEPPLAANIGGRSMWEDVGRNPHATYATRVTLSTVSPFLRQARRPRAMLHSGMRAKVPVQPDLLLRRYHDRAGLNPLDRPAPAPPTRPPSAAAIIAMN
jgi:hypothetical protein